MIKELVEYIVKNLVSDPGNVQVLVVKKGKQNFLEIHVRDFDRGKVIGKEGQTIKALRALVGAIVPDKKVMIDIAK